MALADGRSLPASVLASEAGRHPTGGQRPAEPAHARRSDRRREIRAAPLLPAGLRPGRQHPGSPRRRRAHHADPVPTPRHPRSSPAPSPNLLRPPRRTARLRPHPSTARPRGATGQRRHRHHPPPACDPLSAPLPDHPYQLGADADTVLERIGVNSNVLAASSASRRPLLRFCLDWRASNATTSAAGSAPPSSPRSKTPNGSPATAATAPSPSPTSAATNSTTHSASPPPAPHRSRGSLTRTGSSRDAATAASPWCSAGGKTS